MFKRLVSCVAVVVFCSAAVAGGNAGMGKIRAIKTGPNSNGVERIKVVFETEGLVRNESCPSGEVLVLKSQNSESNYSGIMSLTLAAYMSGKTIRYYSYSDDCYVTFATLSEDYI